MSTTPRPQQHVTIEPSGALIAVVMKDGSTELYTVAEAEELRQRGELAPAVADGLALTEDDMWGSDV